MVDQPERKPSEIAPDHSMILTSDKPTTSRVVPPSLSPAKESQENISIRKHFSKRAMGASSPANNKKGTSLRVLKKGHRVNTSTRDGKRPHHKKKNLGHRKAVEELLDQLQAIPIPGVGDAGNKGVDEPMSEHSNPQPSEVREGRY
ncbi:unnamed protein product [Linum trigynum]|uniref:Uncharacterized protein n=1 Tax=Linum trigynum TaxID=586398 RepID=A0AAV2DYL6_9ROSI